MIRFGFRLHVVTLAVAVSYLTLGLFARHDAERFWWVYAILTFMLALTNIVHECRDR